MEQNVTVIRDCPWIIAWDSAGGTHRFAQGDVAFAGDRLVQVGGRYDGPAGRQLDGSHRQVSPAMTLNVIGKSSALGTFCHLDSLQCIA